MPPTRAILAVSLCLLLYTHANSFQISHAYLSRMETEMATLCSYEIGDIDAMLERSGLNDTYLTSYALHSSCMYYCQEADICLPRRACCPDVLQEVYTDGETVGKIPFHCHMTHFKVPGNREEPFVMNGLPMIDTCVESAHVIGVSESDKVKCEQRNVSNIDEMLPVTSEITHLTYLNKYCAVCSDDDANTTLWSAYVGLANPDDGPETLNMYSNMHWRDLYKLTYELGSDVNMYFATDYDLTDTKACYSPAITECNVTGLWTEYDPFYEFACAINRWDYCYTNQSHRPIQVFGNVFCLICNGLQPDARVFWARNYRFEGLFDPSYMARLNYKGELAPVDPNIDSKGNESCPFTEFFDPVNEICRPWICPRGTFYHGETCTITLMEYAGRELMFFFRVGPMAGDIYRSLTSDDVRVVTQELRNILMSNKLGYEGGTRDWHTFTFQQVSVFGSSDDNDIYFVFIFGTKSTIFVERYLDEITKNDSFQFAIPGTDMSLNIDAAYEIGLKDSGNYIRGDESSLVLVNVDNGDTSDTIDYVGSTAWSRTPTVLERVSKLLICTRFTLNEDEYTLHEDYLTMRNIDAKFYSSQYEMSGDHSVRMCVDDYLATGVNVPETTNGVRRDCSNYLVAFLRLLSLLLIVKLL